MSVDLATLFQSFDRGVLPRRQLLHALGIAVVVHPVSAFAQGQCGGALKGTPQCDPTPAKAPFASTGWKTAWLDHISYEIPNYKETVAFYAALLGWTPGEDEGSQWSR